MPANSAAILAEINDRDEETPVTFHDLTRGRMTLLGFARVWREQEAREREGKGFFLRLVRRPR